MIINAIPADNSSMNWYPIPLLIPRLNVQIARKRILNGCYPRHAFLQTHMQIQTINLAVLPRDFHEPFEPVVTGK